MNLRILVGGLIIPFLGSMILVYLIHPAIVRLAINKNLVDNPNARNLQKNPIPVLGGIAVFWGIVVGGGVTSVFFDSYALFPTIVAITIMMYMGTMDDIMGLSATLRLCTEVLIIGFLMYMSRYSLDNFHGALGLYELPVYVAIPISIVSGTGIINAINMIDGVDGLSSGFCILACAIFGFAFVTSGDGSMTVMAMLSVGSLIPFFLHNVFGKTSKMFIGDSGTLMMGTILSIFIFHILDTHSRVAYNYPNMGVVAFTLSVLSIPVFDTLRVMTTRMLKGNSPFHPDKTHLHHLFIEIGFSHVGTAFFVNLLNLLNVACWLLSYQLGGTPTVQLFVVCLIGFFNTTGFYIIVRRLNHSHSAYKTLKLLAEKSHIETGKTFIYLRKVLDKT